MIREQELAHTFIDYITPKKHHNKVDIIVPQIKRIVTRYSFGILLQITAIFTLLSYRHDPDRRRRSNRFGVDRGGFQPHSVRRPHHRRVARDFAQHGTVYALGAADPNVDPDLVQGLYLLVGLFAVVQLLDNIVFQPFIFSNSVGAHPLEIFIVISIAGTLLGIAGMIFAVPAYSIIRVVINTVRDELNQGS